MVSYLALPKYFDLMFGGQSLLTHVIKKYKPRAGALV